MKRQVAKIRSGKDSFVSVVRITSDAAPGGNAGFFELAILLQTIAADPGLLRYVSDCPDSVLVTRDGPCWILETRAEIEQESEGHV